MSRQIDEDDSKENMMADEETVFVSWNEFVTYGATIRRSVMDEAIKAKDSNRPWDFYGIVFDAAIDLGDPQIVDSNGMENITFHDEKGNEI